MPGAAVGEMTLEQWASLPDDEGGELLDGRLVEEEVTDAIHETVVSWLAYVFNAWAVPRGGIVGSSDAKFAVAPRRGRKPDLWLYRPGTSAPPRRGLIRHPPDVMVEVLSPTPRDARRDRHEKMEDYGTFGVRYYWIVDPEARLVEVFELGADGRYARAAGASNGSMSAPGCDGLVVDLDELWAVVDRLGPEEPPSA